MKYKIWQISEYDGRGRPPKKKFSPVDVSEDYLVAPDGRVLNIISVDGHLVFVEQSPVYFYVEVVG